MSNKFSFISGIFTRESYSPEQSTHIILKADVTPSLRMLLKVVFIIISLIQWFKSIVLCFFILLIWCKYGNFPLGLLPFGLFPFRPLFDHSHLIDSHFVYCWKFNNSHFVYCWKFNNSHFVYLMKFYEIEVYNIF